MDQKQQIAEKLKSANNILVTVSNNPSVDQLASCIGLTLALNKMGKHATAVFSGKVPSTIEFLEPEKTFEGNIDSLRDFIISLDKAKADKLRYKIEDSVVKIFITPYHTSLSDKDLEFSQGDFNVDAVVALGVIAQPDIDQAIAAHGRILHDAAVITLNVAPGGDFGSINWLVPNASSLCELAAELVSTMDQKAFDGQIATALLTGVVAETQRFSNNKTTPITMSVSAGLMAAGANQQLVVTKLDQAVTGPSAQSAPQQAAPGVIQIRQDDNNAGQPDEHTVPIGGGAAQPVAAAPSPPAPEPPKPPEPPKQDDDAKPVSSLEDLAGPNTGQDDAEPALARIRIDDKGDLHPADDTEQKVAATTDPTIHMGGSRMILQPPSMGDGSSGLVGSTFRDPLTPPKPSDPLADQPSGAPPAPPGPSPFMPPASASVSAPSLPFMPPGAGPAAQAPAPFTSAPSSPFDSGQSGGVPALPPSGTDNARSAVQQAFGPPPPPPDLAAPSPIGGPAPSSTPVGPPPPVPPPMLPSPQ